MDDDEEDEEDVKTRETGEWVREGGEGKLSQAERCVVDDEEEDEEEAKNLGDWGVGLG